MYFVGMDLFGFAHSRVGRLVAYGRPMADMPDDGDSAGGFRVLGGRLVYDGPEVRVDQVDLGFPDGDRLGWDVVRLPRWASVIVADEHGRVLLVRRYGLARDRWGWELPGGVVEEDEEPCETVARELEEVGGCRAGELALVMSCRLDPRWVDGEHLIFAVQGVESVPDAAGNDGTVEVEWVPARSVRQLIASGEIWAAGTLIGLLAALPGVA
jgi:ADP-ribose pyrophosphatase YjhB (NUDIX family)